MNTDYVKKYLEQFEEIYKELEDNISEKRFEAYLKAKINEDSSYLYPYVIWLQYFFETDLWKITKDEILFYAGAYDGDSIRDFLNLTNHQYKKNIACEPDKSNMTKLRQYDKKKEFV